MNPTKNILVIVAIQFILLICTSCKKLVHIPEPINTITTPEAFGSDANATSAITAIYSNMSLGNNSFRFANGATTIFAGESADELLAYGVGSTAGNSFQNNNLVPNNGSSGSALWNAAYFDIYMANAAIEGLQASTNVSPATKTQLLGEAKFIRAFCHFYLVNLFGDIPLITSTSFANNSLLARTLTSQVYQQVITDLQDAQNLLNADYSLSGAERIRANKWAATALLARVYLYTGDWVSAETQASLVISNSSLFSLTSLNNVFKKNNPEAILQLQIVNTSIYATQEGNQFILTSNSVSPKYYITTQLINSFEADDQRRTTWIDSTTFNSVTYYYPYKYQTRTDPSGNIPEYYTLLRLGEQYLIRAEARAQQNNLSGATQDLNAIRSRAGLPNLSDSLSQEQVLVAVAQERRIELFAELGHRWFDLKRTGQADIVLGPIKGNNWQSTDQLYPIPLSEIQRDPNLTQNPGY